MRVVELDTFLGCFKLRSGCLFIGYCGSIFGILGLILSGIGIVYTAMRRNLLTGDHKIINEILMGVAIYLFIVCTVSFVLHVVLLKGVYERKARLLNRYVIIMSIYLAFTFIVALVVTVKDPSHGFSYIFSFVVNIYYLLVVESHRKEIKNSTQQSPASTKA